MTSNDQATDLSLSARRTDELPRGSAFGSLAVASEFFRRGSLGYSACADQGTLDGLELRTANWSISALDVTQLKSHFFDDRHRFPAGSIAFDSALLMTNVEHEWHAQPTLRSPPTVRRGER